ncbi:MAG: hypothetical protein RLZZ546_820 [Bacteroidota bacterium]
MRTKLAVVVFILSSCFSVSAQSGIDSVLNHSISFYYAQGVKFKDGIGVAIDYEKAFKNFSKAAELGDEQSVYAQAYLYFKGLGCNQDYTKAAQLFLRGAKLERDNSMYFYGLCWRNGYGVVKNADSAKYWLSKSAAVGYLQAIKELQTPIGENINDSAFKLVQQINNAAIPDKKITNNFNKIRHYIPTSEIVSGNYKGFIIQYDWSGKYITSSKSLQLNLSLNSKKLTGLWIEDQSDSIKLSADLSYDSLRFDKMEYRRKDHYSQENGIKYNFQNANLNLVQTGDSIFLAGNMEMFSPQRNEPSKPIFIVLARAYSSIMAKKLHLRTFPNPFNSLITAQFEIPKAEIVEIQILTLEGVSVYRNYAGLLEIGHYSLPIKVNNLSSGTYLLKFTYGNQVQISRIIKQ